MEFVGFKCRQEGRLLPRHVMWSTKVRGDLFVREHYDPELSRHMKVATLEAGGANRIVLGPLLDAVLVSCKPDWWTLTGWERVESETATVPRAFQQSWILQPIDRAE